VVNDRTDQSERCPQPGRRVSFRTIPGLDCGSLRTVGSGRRRMAGIWVLRRRGSLGRESMHYFSVRLSCHRSRPPSLSRRTQSSL